MPATKSPTAWHFNLLAGPRAVGRQPHTGSRRYYHADLLGSVRAVVTGATVVEATDYDPWGVVLAGRSLGTPGSGTREGFTSQPRDLTVGWDDFGARQYLAAYGRWGGVDPLAEAHAPWSPYQYVFNDPNRLADPDGRTPCLLGPVAARICQALATVGGATLGAMVATAWVNAEQGRSIFEGVGQAGLEAAAEAAPFVLLPMATGPAAPARATGATGREAVARAATNGADDAARGGEAGTRLVVNSAGETQQVVNGLRVGEHAALRMTERGVSLSALERTLGQTPSRYFHEGAWKTGYYDPASRVFVGSINGELTTVINGATPRYIENLMRAASP